MVRMTEQPDKCWKSELQRSPEQESLATAELVSREDCLQVTQGRDSSNVRGPAD